MSGWTIACPQRVERIDKVWLAGMPACLFVLLVLEERAVMGQIALGLVADA